MRVGRAVAYLVEHNPSLACAARRPRTHCHHTSHRQNTRRRHSHPACAPTAAHSRRRCIFRRAACVARRRGRASLSPPSHFCRNTILSMAPSEIQTTRSTRIVLSTGGSSINPAKASGYSRYSSDPDPGLVQIGRNSAGDRIGRVWKGDLCWIRLPSVLSRPCASQCSVAGLFFELHSAPLAWKILFPSTRHRGGR